MKIFKYMALALAAVMTMGCAQEYLEVDPDMAPQASELKINIVPDQETNYVTFSVENEGVVPMWIFGDEKVDGKAAKAVYTGNGISLRFREAGEHSVEVKAYNAHGTSVGSVQKTFTLDNTYRDPFDPTPYMKAIAGEWQWNSEVAGHFGCGENVDNPIGWWSCGANEKADWSLYNDRMTFTEDGKYTFNPGEDGKVYVNKGVTALGGGPQDEDYLVDIAEYTSTYTFENSWNDAGVEEIWLVLPENTNLSYIPDDAAYAAPRFLVKDSKPSAMRKELKLVASLTGICWYYNFIPASAAPGADEFLTGTEAAGKVWIMDSKAVGHLACGENKDNPANWWAAQDNEKAGCGMYDNTLTFCPDGTFKFNPGEDGMIYVNKGTSFDGNPNDGNDFMVAWEEQEGKYEFDGGTLTLPAEFTVGYIPDDAVYNEPKFIVKEITEETLVLVSELNDISWQYIFKPYVEGDGDEEEPVEEAFNMWDRAAIDQISTYFVPDWGQQPLDVEYEIVDRGYVITIPEGTGASTWMGQFAVNHTNIVTTADNAYDFKFVLNSTADHPGVTIKATYFDPNIFDNDTQSYGKDGASYFDAKHVLKAGEDYVYEVKAAKGLDIPCLKLVFDFGGAVGGSVVTIKDIVIMKSNGTPSEEPEPEPSFSPGTEIDLMEAADYIVGTWTWESSTDGHFGCGDAIANPLGWWNGPANCKADGSMYDDLLTFGEDGTYTFDPVDGHTYINTGVTKLDAVKVDQPYGDDWRITAEKSTSSYSIDDSGEYPAIVLEAGTYFSYVPNDAFLEAPELYITAMWENQVEISAYTATGNGGGAIAWRYRLKRVQ